MPFDARPIRKVRIAAALGIFAFALVIFFKNNVLTAIGNLITTTSESVVRDGNLAIVLMGDQTGERAQAAVDFWNKYPETSIVIAPEEQTTFVARGYSPPGHQVHKKFLLDAGVPTEKIHVPDCLNTSTFDEAVCLRGYQTKVFPNVESIMIITSWYHSSRALWIFTKVFQGSRINLDSYIAQSDRSSPNQWWTREQTFLQVFNEYLKWAYWLVHSDSVKNPEP